jgi:4-amino-4-deoxy-L-arabinose transferase-like glycosyltransferase
VLRMPSLIAGIGTILLVWLLGRRVFDWRAGLVGAGLIAFSPFAAFYSTEARAYALMMVCVVASTVVLLEAVERDEPRWWVGYGALTALALWSHYTAIFVIAAQALWVVWAHPRRWLGLAASQAAVAITFLPWIPNISGTRAEGAIEELVPLTVPHVAEQAATLLVGAQNVPLSVIPGVAVGIVVGGAAATAAVFLLAHQLATPMPALRRDVVLLVAAALVTPLGVLAYSTLFSDISLTRNLLASLPAASVLIGATLTRLPRAWAMAATAVVLGCFVISAVHSARPSLQRPDYEGVASYVDARAPPDAPVLDVPLFQPVSLPGVATALEVSVDRPHRLVEGGNGPAAVRAWNSHGPILLVAPESFLAALNFTPPHDLQLVAHRRFEGALPIVVNTYARGH